MAPAGLPYTQAPVCLNLVLLHTQGRPAWSAQPSGARDRSLAPRGCWDRGSLCISKSVETVTSERPVELDCQDVPAVTAPELASLVRPVFTVQTRARAVQHIGPPSADTWVAGAGWAAGSEVCVAAGVVSSHLLLLTWSLQGPSCGRGGLEDGAFGGYVSAVSRVLPGAAGWAKRPCARW